MRIRLTRSGGLAGFEREEVASLDTATLDEDLALKITDLILEITELDDVAIGTDMLRYDIEISSLTDEPMNFVLMDDGNPEGLLHKLLVCVHGAI